MPANLNTNSFSLWNSSRDSVIPMLHSLVEETPAKRSKFPALHVYMGLLMSVVGSGMLSVPYTFILIPIEQALIGIILIGFCMGCSAHALLHAHVQVSYEEELQDYIGAGKRFAGFQSMAIKAGGQLFGYVVSIVTAVGIFGGCVGGIRIVRDLTPYIVALVYEVTASTSTPLSNEQQDKVSSALLWVLFAVVVFPLCTLKNLSALKVTTYIGFTCSLYLVLTIAYRSLAMGDPGNEVLAIGARTTNITATVVNASTSGSNNENIWMNQVVGLELSAQDVGEEDVKSSASDLSRFAQSISIYNFAFMMQLNLLPLFVQLRGDFAAPLAATRVRFTRTIVGVTLFCIFLYALFGLCTARLYGNSIKGNVLLNLENDTVMNVPVVAVYLTIIATFPLLFHPLRSVVEELAFRLQPVDVSLLRRLFISFVLLFAALLIALVAPGIEIVFSLVGATSCMMICYVFPVIMFTQIYPWRQVTYGKLWVAMLWMMVAFVVFMGAVAVWFLFGG